MGVGVGVGVAWVDGRVLASVEGVPVALGDGVEQPATAQAAAIVRAARTRGVVTREL